MKIFSLFFLSLVFYSCETKEHALSSMEKELLVGDFLFIDKIEKNAINNVSDQSLDTISYVHVYINDSLVFNGSLSFGVMFKIKKDSLKVDDILHIKYFKDSPCFECESIIEIRNSKNELINKINSSGTYSRKSILLFDFINEKNKRYYFWYYEGFDTEKSLLFDFELI